MNDNGIPILPDPQLDAPVIAVLKSGGLPVVGRARIVPDDASGKLRFRRELAVWAAHIDLARTAAIESERGR